MAEAKEVFTPLDDSTVAGLKAGDSVRINGVVYTARDAAHKRLVDLIESGGETPIDLAGQIIYFVGPTPPRPGRIIGAAGPTTSYRMDPYSPRLIEQGLKGMIGKGPRSAEVIEAMRKYKCLYFAAIGGAGALISKSIVGAEVVAYSELGPEAIRKLVVKGFPAIVVNDIYGNDLYVEGRREYGRERSEA